ncbi:hypothetical protein [Nocardia testacea]|uniref:hypothetical protein n=1 Tax=Nocardia testacea TaxID=248551 RepID=UPI003410C7E1
MGVNVDPERMRALGRELRVHATALAGFAPMAKESRDEARLTMKRSDLAVKIEESLKALDGVVKYHADRLNRFGDELDRQAAEYEALDNGVTGQLKEAGPR